MSYSFEEVPIQDNGGTRSGNERRLGRLSYQGPERRSGQDRRRGFDRRAGLDRRRSADRRRGRWDGTSIERRDIFRK